MECLLPYSSAWWRFLTLESSSHVYNLSDILLGLTRRNPFITAAINGMQEVASRLTLEQVGVQMLEVKGLVPVKGLHIN